MAEVSIRLQGASIKVRDMGHGVFLFDWVGPATAPLYVAHQLERQRRIMGLIPWPLRKVGDNLRYGFAVYRRA